MPHQLTPTFIIENVAHGQLTGTLEAVVLLVDISGFTAVTNRLMHYGTEGAEVLAAVLVEIFEPLLHLVYRQGGFVATFGGDAFKALFPIHQTTAPDTVYARALVAAAQIRQYLVAHGEQTTRFGVFHFAGKVCLASGTVAWGVWQGTTALASADQRAAYYVEGAALDACLALDSYGTAGEVLLTQAVYAALPGTVTLLQLEPVADHWRLGAAAEGDLNDWRPVLLATPAAPDDLAARFFPPALLQMSTQGEFRRVVTLFLNLRAAPQTLDSAFQHTFFRLLAQYGGYLCRVSLSGSGQSGSTLLLFWGAPVSHENDGERALSFVQALQAASPAPIRAGITTGLAYAGFIGSALREEYTCYGSYVNLAVRQMTRAAWGEIWLDAETARQAQTAFAVMPHGHFTFKGFAQEQPVFLLGDRQDFTATFYQGAMVGRQAELTQLQAAIQPIFAGHFAGVILITGEAGMGKSRLVHELQRRLAKTEEEQDEETSQNQKSKIKNPQWFLGQTDEILRQPLNPFRYWLRSYFQQSTSADEAANKAVFTAKLDELLTGLRAISLLSPVSSLVSEIERTRSFLGALVDLHWPDSLYAQLEPQLRFENTLAALKSLILAESLRQPVILHLEDIHWLDQESHTFLSRLLHNVTEYPLAVIMTTRPAEEAKQQAESAPASLGSEGMQVIVQLTTLTMAEITALATAQLHGTPAPSLMTLLLARAEGNPFFAEQLLHYLQEQGGLIQGPDGWQLPTDPATLTLLPRGARELLVARLDRLPQPAKEVVQTAAVLGREFDTQVLAEMLADDTALADKLRVADQAAIWSAITQVRYLFRHALLREAAYDMQLRARLRLLHQRAAEALQALFPERLAPYYADLAYHYDRAEVAAQATAWYGLAGEQAASSYANSEAVHYFSRALDLMATEQAETRFKLLLGREAVYDVLGQVEAQRHDIARLAEVADQLADPARQAQAALRRADHLRMTGNYAAALVATQHAAALASQINNLPLMSSIHHHWGRMDREQGDYSGGKRHLEQALRLAQASQYLHGEAKSLIDLGTIHFYESEYAIAEIHFTAALALYQALGERKGEIGALAMVGTIANETARYETALAYYQKAQELCHAIGYAYGEAFVLGNLGMNYICLGSYETAKRCLAQAIEKCRERKDRHSEGVYLDSLAVIHLQQSAESSAIYTCEQALVLQQTIGDRRFEAYSLTYQGEALRRLGDLPAAYLAYEQALTIRRQLGEEQLTLEIQIGLAQIMLAQGQVTAAQGYLTTVLTWIEAHGIAGIEFPIQLYLSCYQLLLALDEPEQARTMLMAGYHLLQSRAEKIEDAQLRQRFLEAVPFNRELASIWQKTLVIH